jgi:ATP-binding cassette, subfamily F, member 3
MANKLLLQANGLSKNYGEKIILEDATVSINERQKIGVIGRNGAGKSTFFKMLTGDEQPDSGELVHMPDLRLGYIPQVDPFTPDETVLGFLMRYTKREDWECAKVAGQFQLKGAMLEKPIGDLSGGYQMRVKLTSTLLFEPNLLLLDEPTNYLDLSTLILLENFLKTFKGGFLCITHDREFLKKTCTSTMEVEHGKIVLHHEPLEAYLEFKAEQQALAENQNKNIDLKQKQLQTFVDKFGSKASKAKSAQSKMKQITRLDKDRISIASTLATVRMVIPLSPARSGIGLSLDQLTIGYPERVIASGIQLDVDKGQKVAILGDNGQGKSTLLKTMAGHLDALNGKVRWSSELKIAYYAQHVHLALDPEETVHQYLKRTANKGVDDATIYKMMGNFLFKKGETQKQVKVMSGGEKARLCLAGMFLSQSDVLLLDEPTNHLDYQTVEAMGAALREFNGTVFVVSHDRTFVNLLATEIWEVQDGNVRRILGDYESYVWQKEEEAQKMNSSESASTTNQPAEVTAKQLDKQARKQLYELEKELKKIDKKIQSLKETSPGSTELTLSETRWLEINEKIERL